MARETAFDVDRNGEEPCRPRTDGGRDGGELVLIMAVVRPEKLSDVKQALAEEGARGLTVTNVSGRGNQPVERAQWRGEEYTVDLHQKVKVECVIGTDRSDDIVTAIRESAHTGEPGDGKIFVLPVYEAHQIRTDESGIDAV